MLFLSVKRAGAGISMKVLELWLLGEFICKFNLLGCFWIIGLGDKRRLLDEFSWLRFLFTISPKVLMVF